MPIPARRRATAGAAVALAVLALAAAGCGGSGGSAKVPTVNRAPAPAPRIQAGPARPRDVSVIRGWVDALRAGRVAAAAGYFSLPTLVANQSPEFALVTPPAARAFNASLPCGARLLEARRVGSYTIATFRLTERPGGDCGPGTGQKAATAFRFRGGKISEWRRVDVPSYATPAPPGPSPSQQV